MAWISEYQKWLSESESLNNAQMVADHFNGWSPESISALCGNMRHESSINPDMYEFGYDWSADRGYGLVQWTPRSKYWDWAVSKGLSPRNGDSQLSRIDYEVDQNIQWIDVGYMSFKAFRENSGDWSVDYLTEAFTWCYERPNASAGQQSMPERIAFAKRCLSELDFSGSGSGPGGGGGGDGSGRQLAVLPIDVVNITQGEYGSFSHYSGSNQELAIDFLGWGPNGRINRYPLQAPFDSEVIGVLPEFAQVNWRNTVPVKGADGKDYENLVYTIVHDWDYNRWSVGDTISKGEHIGNTGSAGQSTGDHLHLQVIEAETHLWPTPISAQRHIYDIFDTKHVTMWINDGGYDWKELDYQDGTGGGGDDGQTSTKGDIYYLLLSGAMAGW